MTEEFVKNLIIKYLSRKEWGEKSPVWKFARAWSRY